LLSGRSHPVRLHHSSSERRSGHTAPWSHDIPTSQSAVALSSQATGSRESTNQRQGQGQQDSAARGRRSNTIYVEQVTETSGSGQEVDIDGADADVQEVEVAEEATSEMAFQTLHQASTDSPSRYVAGGSREGSPSTQDIPLEDLSRKMKSKKEQLTRARLTKSRLAAELKKQHDHARSNSQSPKRKSSSESSSSVLKAKPRGRSTSLNTDKEGSPRSRSGTPEKRAHSQSNPLPQAVAYHTKSKGKSLKEIETQTNFPVNLKLSQNNLKSSSHASESGSSVANQPKTLQPAPSPVVSLVIDSEEPEQIKDSPKILPPIDQERIRSGSECSTTSSELPACGGGSDVPDRPMLALNTPSGAGAEMSSASATMETLAPPPVAKSQSASEKLTELAQMVQQYNFDADTLEQTTDIDK